MVHIRRLTVLAFITLLAGCSSSADISLAEGRVPQFHQMLDGSQFQQIYTTSSEALRKASTEKDLVALLDAVHRKLGATRSSVKQGELINFNTSGTYVTLTYKTRFSDSDAIEQFVYRIDDHKALLAGYHINSSALITR